MGGLPQWLSGKGSACNAGDPGLIPGSGRSPGGGLGSPLQYSCLENPMDKGSLSGYSPWGHKESDTTEVTEHAHVHTIPESCAIVCGGNRYFFLYSLPWINTSLNLLAINWKNTEAED